MGARNVPNLAPLVRTATLQLVDRFHLSTQSHQLRKRGVTLDFSWLEERLKALNFRLVLCIRNPETFEAARRERLKVSGNPRQYDDLSEIIARQRAFQRLAAASLLPVFELDVTAGNLGVADERVANWLATTGGLEFGG